MKLRTPGTVGPTIAALTTLSSNADAVLSGWPALARGNLEQAKAEYLRWVETATMTVENYLENDDLADGLRAYGYWQIYRLTEADPRPYPMVEHEVKLQRRRLDAVIARLNALKPFIERTGSIVMPDTSAFIEGMYFTHFDWAAGLAVRPLPVRLVVPGLVIEELEKRKTFERGRVQDRARQVLKDLRQLLLAVKPGEAAELRANVTIEALMDDDTNKRLENNDGEIIDQAVQVQRLTGRPVTLVCLDLPMELRTRLRGVSTAIMPARDETNASAQEPGPTQSQPRRP